MPPFATASMEEPTSLARSITAVERAPAVALRKPESEPTDNEPKKPCVDEAYDADTRVVDAFTTVSVSVDEAYVNPASPPKLPFVLY